MANRRPQPNNRRSDFGRNDRGNNYGRNTVSPWQGGGPGTSLPSLLPLAAGSTEATLALASNIINLLQPRQNTVPSLLDMPMRRDFGSDLNRYNRGFGSNKMGNQGNFRRTGTYPRSGDRIGNRRPNRPSDGPRQQYKSSPKKDYDSKAKLVKESSQDNKDAEGTEKTEKVEGDDKKNQNRFSDIDPKLLICHICNKSMWDGRSFENHLNGRAHAIMMQKTAESYALTADTMRQEFKIREMKRTRKIGKQTPRDFYCAMCDLYAADGPEHRTTVGHRKLKKYLHPPCISCHKEMPTRIELDEHRLTPEHMRKIQGNPMQMQPEMMQIYTLSMEQSFVRENRDNNRRFGDRKGGKKEKESESQEPETKEDEEQGEKEEPAENGGEEKPEDKTKEVEEENLDAENTIIDFKEGEDDLSNITSDMLPKYSPKRGVGKSFLSEFRCIQCKLCNKLLDSDETAEVHLKTWRHHRLFTRVLSKHIEPTEDKVPVEDKVSAEDTEKELESNKRPLPTEDSGNWKRRKVTTSENDEQNGHDEDMKDETVAEDEEEGADEEMPSTDDVAAKESMHEEQAEKKAEEIQIKKEKDEEILAKTSEVEKIEDVEVKQEVKDSPAKGRTATRGRGRGRRTRN